jgi:hypothetical protein
VIWANDKRYNIDPFDKENDLEAAILEVQREIFGPERVYLDVKKRIGERGKISNIPDAYLVDLSSTREPKLYVVENELAKHEPLKHIAVQILELSLSFETTPQKVKAIVKEQLQLNPDGLEKSTRYAEKNGFDNVDYLLERVIFPEKSFNALVVIDELDPQLETVLISRFQFPVEIIEFKRFKTAEGQKLYQFEPFLADVAPIPGEAQGSLPPLDPSEIDTIVVPAQDEGFRECFLGENRWYQIRIHSSMLSKIKHIAVYRVAPISAITHIADVQSIEQWKETNKYVVNFAEAAQEIDPIKLVPKSAIKAPQAPRYTSLSRLGNAKNLNEAF